MRRAAAGVGVIALTVVALSLFADPNAEREVATKGPTALVTAAVCPLDGSTFGVPVKSKQELPAPGRAPAGFVATRVVSCTLVAPRNDGSGQLRYAIATNEGQATAGVIDALSLPDLEFRHPARGACTMDYVPLPYLLMVDAQREAYRPHIPVDACGNIRVEVQEFVSTLRLSKTSQRTVTYEVDEGS